MVKPEKQELIPNEHFWAEKLPDGWNYDFLSNLIDKYVDNRGKTVPTSDHGIPLIATNCISNDSLFPKFKKLRYVTKETYDNWFRDGHPKPGDIIFVNKGTPGMVCIVPDPVNFCFAQDMIAIRVNHKTDNKFLLAVLRSNFIQKQIEGFHVGTLIPHLKKTDFNNIIIPLPTEKEQKMIGNLYYNFSMLIELLVYQNQTLEKIIQTIFKSWFVDFDGQTEFVDSELGQIPKGWCVKKFEDVFALRNGKFFETDYYSKNGKYPVYGSNGIIGFSNKFINENPVMVIGRVGAYCGSLYRIDVPSWTTDNSIVVEPQKKDEFDYFFYSLCRIDLTEGKRGSAQPLLAQSDLRIMKLIYPDYNMLSLFTRVVKPMTNAKIRNDEVISYLTKIRDSLLPKLMSGEIRV